VAIDAPDAIIPIRTLRNISLNPNFGGEVMVVSLGCEKLQPERLLPPGSIPIVDERSSTQGLDVVCLQDEPMWASCRWSSPSCGRPRRTCSA
jgi:galactarate dehydratase